MIPEYGNLKEGINPEAPYFVLDFVELVAVGNEFRSRLQLWK